MKGTSSFREGEPPREPTRSTPVARASCPCVAIRQDMDKMPMPRCFFHIAVLLLLLQSAVAQPQPMALEAKGFKGFLAVTDDANFYTDWKKPETPTIRKIENVSRGQKIFAIVIFSNIGANEKGAGNVTFDFSLKGPDGTFVDKRENVDALAGRPPSPIGILMLSCRPVWVKFDQSDPSGEYTFHVMLTDHVKNVTLPLMYKVQLK